MYEQAASQSIDRYLDIDTYHKHKIREFMVCDEDNDQYPYLTLLLLFHGGLHQEAIWFCSQQALKDVQNFGERIYAKYYETYNCNLP